MKINKTFPVLFFRETYVVYMDHCYGGMPSIYSVPIKWLMPSIYVPLVELIAPASSNCIATITTLQTYII